MNLRKLNQFKLGVIALMAVMFLSGGVIAQKSQSRGGGNGPAPTPTPTNPLPQTPPSPDIVYRESFGLGPDIARPTGGKGTMKTTYLHTGIRSFWLEYPGSKNTQWQAPDAVESWRFCGATDNPYELFSPLQWYQGMPSNGCVMSEWFEVPVTNPTALMPITAPNVPYEITMQGYPGPFDGRYLAIGLTNSATLTSNLQNSGSVVLAAFPTAFASQEIRFEFHSGSINGPLLGSVTTYSMGWNQFKIRVDPVNKTIGASANDIELGTFPADIGSPRYFGFEGIGMLDNLIIRKTQ